MTEKLTLTTWGDPNSNVEMKLGDRRTESGYGRIKYQEWCEKERDRINSKWGEKVYIVTRANGDIALSR